MKSSWNIGALNKTIYYFCNTIAICSEKHMKNACLTLFVKDADKSKCATCQHYCENQYEHLTILISLQHSQITAIIALSQYSIIKKKDWDGMIIRKGHTDMQGLFKCITSSAFVKIIHYSKQRSWYLKRIGERRCI